ncbi:MAG: B12-binding domain-containing radical SAM protein [Nanoarchaeota archaeon]
MASNKKIRLVLVGIAGTQNDFLLALHTLKCFIYQDSDIRQNVEVIIKQFYYIPPENIKKRSEEILREIEELNPDLVGFSSYVWDIDAVNLISANLKQKYPNIKILLGGPEIAKEDILSGKLDNLNADFLIFGEAEKPLLVLLQNLLGLNKKLEDIKGLAFRRDDSFICNDGSDFIEDLDKTPSAYLNGYVSDEILSRPDIRVNIETQRGCNFKCAYCFYHKGFPNIRYRNTDTVINELDYAFKKGIKTGRILDANFLSNKAFAKKILEGWIKRRIKMSLFLEILPIFLDEEIAHLFGDYSRISPENRIMIGVGIQTINQESLAVIRRQISVSCFEKAFNLLQKENIIIKADIILGLPRESKETYFKTLEFITEKMRYGTNYLSLAILRILPGTDMVEIARKEKMVVDTRDSSHVIYSTPTLPRKDLLECIRLNTAAFRILSSIDLENRMKIRDLYFDVKDTLKATNIQLLSYFAEEFFEFLKDKDVDYVKPDFPNADYYSGKDIYDDIHDEWIIKKLEELKQSGLGN